MNQYIKKTAIQAIINIPIYTFITNQIYVTIENITSTNRLLKESENKENYTGHLPLIHNILMSKTLSRAVMNMHFKRTVNKLDKQANYTYVITDSDIYFSKKPI
jgi:hypothetical protein